MVKLKRNLLSVALVSAMTLGANAAYAQSNEATAGGSASDQDAVELDRVTVTGIRRGIEDAIDTKQSEGTIVEAISAEDIGKLPDTSIADSLARLPGLTAQRFGGRPQEINIRGFAGDFSTTLLNGREQVSLGNNRGVEFDQYPSELVSAVVVHKTVDASLVGQGLSGTVNMKTVRPLAFGDRVVALNARADMNKVQDEKLHGERYSVSYIDQFADNTVGLALGYAHLNNPGQSHQFESWGYNGDGSLGGGNIFALENENKRDGFAATLEFKPNEDFSSVLDFFYSKFDKKENKKGVQFGLSNTVAEQTSANGTVTQGTADISPGVLRNDYNAQLDNLTSVGWTNELKLGQAWKLTTDIGYSAGKRRETVLETYAVAAPGANNTLSYTYNPDGYFDFDFGLDFSDLDSFSLMDPGGWGGDRAQAGYLKNFEVKDSLTSVRFDLGREFEDGMFSTLNMGVNLTDRQKSRASVENTLCMTPACVVNVSGAVPAEYATNIDLGFAGLSSFLGLDPLALVDNVYYQLQKDNKDISNKNWEIRERVGTVYAQANINTDLGPVPLKGNVGVQIVNVEQSATGFASYAGNPVGEPIDGGANYTNYLPSLNLSFGFPADQYIRVGASRQMARPRMDQLRSNTDIGFDATRTSPNGNVGSWTQTSGNPELRPFLSNSYDVAYEKYFQGNRGYVSAAYFFKDLSTYIYDSVTPFDVRETPFPVDQYPVTALDPIGYSTQPVNGTGGTIKGYELSVSVPFDLLWSPLEGFGFVGSYSDTTSSIQPNGPNNPSDVLPGLSKYVSNMTLYFERWGFSTRVSQRSRSKFVGEVQGFGGDRQRFSFDGEKVVDVQMGYMFQSGPLENLSILLQVNNLTDEPFRRINSFDDRPAQFTEYGRTYLLGLNYKF